MMTETLRRAVAQVEQLWPDQQDAFAELMLRVLEEREWDALVTSEASQDHRRRLVVEARAEDAAGETQNSTDRW